MIGGPRHHELAEKAMRAKQMQNRCSSRALATADLRLAHQFVDGSGSPVPDSLSLPAAVFCAIWTKLRDEALTEEAAATPDRKPLDP